MLVVACILVLCHDFWSFTIFGVLPLGTYPMFLLLRNTKVPVCTWQIIGHCLLIITNYTISHIFIIK